MSKATKIIVTLVLSIAFILILAAIGNSGAEVGSPIAILSVFVAVGYIAALIGIWKKKKEN